MIIAGCGYAGTRFARLMRGHGQNVLGLVSRDERVAELGKLGIHALSWPLDDAGPAPEMGSRTHITYLIPPPASGTTDTRLAHFLGALDRPPRRFVYISTTGVYGNHDGARVDETTPATPQSARAKRRLAAETFVRDWCNAHAVEWVILRVPGIYGPHRLQLATIEAQKPMLRPELAGPGNRIHVDDLVQCLEAANITAHINDIYNVGDGNPASNTEFVTEVARQFALSPPPQADLETVRAAVGARRWSFVRESRQVDTQRMRRILGVVPRYSDIASGIAASRREMQSRM